MLGDERGRGVGSWRFGVVVWGEKRKRRETEVGEEGSALGRRASRRNEGERKKARTHSFPSQAEVVVDRPEDTVNSGTDPRR